MDHRDIVEIEQLIAAYGHAVDAGRQGLIPLIFAADAIFDAPFGRYEGAEGIAEWFALGKPPHPPSHHSTNVWVREERGKTRVSSKWLVIDRATGQPCSGDYEDVVVRTADGWRIASRICIFRHPAKEDYAARREPPAAGADDLSRASPIRRLGSRRRPEGRRL